MVKYILLLLLIPSLCFSEIKGHVEIGKDIDYNIAYTELQIGYNYKWFYFYGNQQTWLEYRNMSGYPFNDIYTIGLDSKYENITINISHFCSHKVISTNSEFVNYYKPPQDGNLTKLSVKYDF
jgi:hypothetical protein